MGKNAWDGCDAWDNRPKTLPQGLKLLADWFDAVYENQGKNDEVQQDLRRWAAYYEALEAKLRDTEAQLAAADNGLMKASDPKSGWQGISKECKLWQEKAEALEAKLAALVKASKEVVRISDRKHDAWDRLKSAIAAAKGTP